MSEPEKIEAEAGGCYIVRVYGRLEYAQCIADELNYKPILSLLGFTEDWCGAESFPEIVAKVPSPEEYVRGMCQ